VDNLTLGLTVFEKELKKALNNRITDFVNFIYDNFSDDLEGVRPCTKREWTERFRAWSISRDDKQYYNRLIKRYLDEE
jgi:hypothetical protein